MKTRTLFLISTPLEAHPDNFKILPEAIEIKSVHAPREDRYVFEYEDLTPELKEMLDGLKGEVSARWTSGVVYEGGNPFAARTPAGLSVVVEKSEDTGDLCPLINTLAPSSSCVDAAFTPLPSGSIFYAPTPVPPQLSSLPLLSPSQLSSLTSASYLDLRLSPVTKTLTINAFFPLPSASSGHTITRPSTHPVEVGVLGLEKPMEESGLALGGLLHQVGHDKKLEPVMFGFANRHHQYPGSFSVDTIKPTGLHPKLQLSLKSKKAGGMQPPAEDCTLNAFFMLPRQVFVDKYQISQSNPQLLQELGIRSINVSGEADLEQPDWASVKWGSTLLAELDPGKSTIEVPLHLRYLQPEEGRDKMEIQVAAPAVFWACGGESEEAGRLKQSPFERRGLGWEGYFGEMGEGVIYHHLPLAADSQSAYTAIEVPVMDLMYSEYVKYGTAIVVVGGFLWVLMKTLLAGGKNKEAEKKTQ